MNIKVPNLLETDPILELLFRYPEKDFHIRELSRMSGVSVRWVSETARSLEKEGFIDSSVVGNIKKIIANRDDKRFIYLKKLWNLRELYSCGIIDYLEETLRPNAIVLFGSYSKGEDISTSDIDIVVIGGYDKDILLDKFEKGLFRRVSLHRMKHTDEGDKEFRHSVCKARVLSGYLKVV